MTRFRACFALFFGLFPVLAFGYQQSPAGFIISGTVVEHATKRPLCGMLVLLSPNEHPNRQLTVVTAGDGRFTFTDLPAAKYSLLAQRPGEQEMHGFQGTEGFSTGIVTGPQMNTANLVFPLDAPASISGTVVDENGDPVRQANVILFRKSVSFGQDQVSQAAQKATGSSGRFHFAHLPQGTYFIAVQAQPWYAQYTPAGGQGEENQPANTRELDVAYPVTYYGDTTSGASAAPIALAEGGSATAQITLRAVPAIHIPLIGADSSQGMNAQVYTEGPGGVPMYAQAITVGVNGSSELTGLAPGHYVVELQSFSQGAPSAPSRQTVDLAEGSTLTLQGAPSVSISGQIAFDGLDHPLDGAFVLISNHKNSYNAAVQQDGSFSFGPPSPPPGHYEIQVSNVPEFFVKSVIAKGAPSSGDAFDIAEGASVQLSITAGKGLSKLDGIALKDEKPMAAAMVLLLPQDLSRSALIRRDQSDSDGTFTLPQILPGRYTLLAIDDGRDLAYKDPAVVKPYLGSGQIIDIPTKDTAPVKVKVLPRKR